MSLGDLLFMKHADSESIDLSGQLSIQKFSQCKYFTVWTNFFFNETVWTNFECALLLFYDFT